MYINILTINIQQNILLKLNLGNVLKYLKLYNY